MDSIKYYKANFLAVEYLLTAFREDIDPLKIALLFLFLP